MLRSVSTLVLALFPLTLVGPQAGGQKKEELPGKPPDPMAPAHKPFGWNSKNDLRFVWWLPKDYDPRTPRNMTVILHGTGLDYRWGWWNHKPGIFRPDDVVISVDGTTPDGKNRVFMGEKKDADSFAKFLAEMRQTFSVDRVFLYGHSQGSFFSVYFAGEHPDLVAGVAAHASGAWASSKMSTDVKRVAIAFMHGTSDPVVPYAQSPGSRDTYAKAGFPLLHLRRLDRYIHWPNAVRANETLDWCQGMTAKSPEEALECALRILLVKPPDETKWETLVGFSAARDVLRRIEKPAADKGPAPFAEVPEKTAAAAAEWVQRIEDEGKRHVEVLKKRILKKKDLRLDGPAPFGHLVALREDFRGVDSVEAFLVEIGYGTAAEASAKAADPILQAWYNSNDPKKCFEVAVENIAKAFLYDGFPPELPARIEEWKKGAARMGLAQKTLKKQGDLDAWVRGWEDGLKQYESVWKKWKGP